MFYQWPSQGKLGAHHSQDGLSTSQFEIFVHTFEGAGPSDMNNTPKLLGGLLSQVWRLHDSVGKI